MKKTRYPGLYRLPDGRFRIRATAKNPRTGKMCDAIRTLKAGTSEEEAVMALLALKQSQREDRVKLNLSSQFVTDYGVLWLGRKARRLKPSVADRYERALGRFILPRLGGIRLDQISRDHVEGWVAWSERATMKDGRLYAKETVMGWWRILRTMLRDAAAELNLPNDPTYRVMAPKPRLIRRREMRTLSPADLEALLDAVKTFCPDRYAEVYLLAFTGMRAGELYALIWDDIDEANTRILIRRSVWKGKVTGTKTDEPREAALTEPIVDVLRAHREHLIRIQHRGLATGLVFPADTGVHRMPQSLHKPLDLAAEAAGIDVKVTAQVLRRTFNTLSLEFGVDRIVLRSQMGHSSEEMTRRYAGIPIGAKCKAVEGLISRTMGADHG